MSLANYYHLLFKQAESKELSAQNIDKMLDGTCAIVPYSNLSKYPDLDSLLGPYECVIILYEPEPRHGHWVSLFRNYKGQLMFYDSLGYKVDQELSFVNKRRQELGLPLVSNDLTRLIAGERVINNTLKIQQDKQNVNTCGRYAVTRILLRNLTNRQFNRIFDYDDKYYPDLFITIYTQMLL